MWLIGGLLLLSISSVGLFLVLKTDTDPLVPLEAGRTLRYEGIVRFEPQYSETDFLEVYALPETEVNGRSVIPMIIHVEDADIKNTLYLRERSDGLQLTRLLSVGGSTSDMSFLNSPYIIKWGGSWRSVFVSPEEDGSVEMNCNSEQLREPVTVTAGTFLDVVKISCELIWAMIDDELEEKSIVQTWFAPGIGLLRGQLQGFRIGMASMELASLR